MDTPGAIGCITVYRDYDLLPDGGHDGGLVAIAVVRTSDPDVAYLLTENDDCARTAGRHRAGGSIAITRLVLPCRSNIVGDWMVYHTPDGDVPYRVASAGVDQIPPAEWAARTAGVVDEETRWMMAYRKGEKPA